MANQVGQDTDQVEILAASWWLNSDERLIREGIATTGKQNAEDWLASRNPELARLDARKRRLQDPRAEVVAFRGTPLFWGRGKKVATAGFCVLGIVSVAMVILELIHVAAVAEASGSRWVQGGAVMPYAVSAMLIFALCLPIWVWVEMYERRNPDSRSVERIYKAAAALGVLLVIGFGLYYGRLAGRVSSWEEAPLTIPAWLHVTLSVLSLSGGVLSAKRKLKELYLTLCFSPLTGNERAEELAECERRMAFLEDAKRETVGCLEDCKTALRNLRDDKAAYIQRVKGVHAANERNFQETEAERKRRRQGVSDYDEKVRQHEDLARVIQFHPYRGAAAGA